MDLLCSKCGEPWDNDTIHDRAQELGLAEPYYLPPVDRYATTRVKNPAYNSEKSEEAYRRVAADFRRRGCEALGGNCSVPLEGVDPVYGLTRREAAGALYDLLGDDMDGAASMLEDMGFA